MRISPRLKFSGDVRLSLGGRWIEVMPKDISLFGIGFRLKTPLGRRTLPREAMVKIRIDGKFFQLRGILERRNDTEFALKFTDDERKIALVVGSYISQKIKEMGTCVYCNSPVGANACSCSTCGMPVNFKRTSVIKKMKQIRLGSLINACDEDQEESAYSLKKHIEKLQEDILKKAYVATGGNISKMAKLLGVSRPTVYKMLRKYSI